MDVTAAEFSPNLLLQLEKNKTNKIPSVHQLYKGLPSDYHFTDRKTLGESNLNGVMRVCGKKVSAIPIW